MTAIGFVLLMATLGIFWIAQWWNFRVTFELMMAGMFLVFASCILLLFGIVTWLWHVMP